MTDDAFLNDILVKFISMAGARTPHLTQEEGSDYTFSGGRTDEDEPAYPRTATGGGAYGRSRFVNGEACLDVLWVALFYAPR